MLPTNTHLAIITVHLGFLVLFGRTHVTSFSFFASSELDYETVPEVDEFSSDDTPARDFASL